MAVFYTFGVRSKETNKCPWNCNNPSSPSIIYPYWLEGTRSSIRCPVINSKVTSYVVEVEWCILSFIEWWCLEIFVRFATTIPPLADKTYFAGWGPRTFRLNWLRFILRIMNTWINKHPNYDTKDHNKKLPHPLRRAKTHSSSFVLSYQLVKKMDRTSKFPLTWSHPYSIISIKIY